MTNYAYYACFLTLLCPLLTICFISYFREYGYSRHSRHSINSVEIVEKKIIFFIFSAGKFEQKTMPTIPKLKKAFKIKVLHGHSCP